MASVRSRGSATRSQKKRAAEVFATIPAFPNAFPYNELLLDGKLKIGPFGVKTRSWEWKHRGLVLLYTSGRVHKPVADAYGLDPKKYPCKMIIGMADLVDVRELTERECDRLRSQFNNISLRQARAIPFSGSLRDWIEPLPIGYFFCNLRRFKKPVPFKWPAGAVTTVRVPVALVARALRKASLRL